MNIGTPRIDLALKALKIPPEKFADKPVSQLDDYVTSVEKVTGRMPSREEVCEAVRQNAERALKVELVTGEVTPEENKAFEKLRPFYTSPEWVYKKSSQQKFSGLLPGLKKAKARHKARKLIIAHVAVDREKKIEQALLCGDFFIQPADVLEDIEKSLRGVEATDEEKILGTVKDALERKKAQIPMLDPKDFALPLTRAAREAAA